MPRSGLQPHLQPHLQPQPLQPPHALQQQWAPAPSVPAVGKAASAPLPSAGYPEATSNYNAYPETTTSNYNAYPEASSAASAELHADYHDPTSNYNARLGYGTDQVSQQ